VRIKLDENLPLRIVRLLATLGHETDTVPQEGLSGQDDSHVWQAAQRAGRFFITQDLDFSDVRRFVPGAHHGLLLVRLRDPGRNALLKRLRSLFQTENVEAWKQCFVVATEHKVRVRAPKKQNDPNNG
jgi:predicted nuclease of predicted toxin-antitoxin system